MWGTQGVDDAEYIKHLQENNLNRNVEVVQAMIGMRKDIQINGYAPLVGIMDDEEIGKVQINGKAADRVIEIDIDGQKWYVWVFDQINVSFQSIYAKQLSGFF